MATTTARVPSAGSRARVQGRERPPSARTGSPCVLELDVRPPGLYRLPSTGRDGTMRRRPDGALERLLHVGDEPVCARAWALSSAVRLRIEAPSRAAAERGVERMRFALGVDHDILPFQRRFARHPLLRTVIRRKPWLRPWRAPDPFQALAWAVCEQLIEVSRAAAIQRRLVWRYGRTSDCGELRCAPSAGEVAARAPAELEACGLTHTRAIALRRVAKLAAGRRLDLEHRHEPAWRALRTVPGIGTWTCEKLAFHGQGRDDQLPAGDLAYVKLVGHLAGLGRRATEDEVRDYFAPYGEHAALAGIYLLAANLARSSLPPAASVRPRAPRPAAARW